MERGPAVREIRLRLGESEVRFLRHPRTPARRHAGMAVADVLHDRHTPPERPRERHSTRVPAGADHERWLQPRAERIHGNPGGTRTAEGLPVLPDLWPIERMQVEERVRELGLRQYIAFDAAACTDKIGLHGGVAPD